MKSLFPSPGSAELIPAPSGGPDFGIIPREAAEKIGVAAGPVRLETGQPGAKGWGAQHVTSNPDRMNRIRGLGFRDLAHFVETVARHHEKICDGREGRLALVHAFRARTEMVDLEVIVQAKTATDGSIFWSVTTAFPKGVSRKKSLYEYPKKVDRTESRGSSLGDASDRPRRETISLPKKSVPRDGNGS